MKKKIKVCDRCLHAIVSKEGKHLVSAECVDETNPIESRCEWCGEIGFDMIYSIFAEGGEEE